MEKVRKSVREAPTSVAAKRLINKKQVKMNKNTLLFRKGVNSKELEFMGYGGILDVENIYGVQLFREGNEYVTCDRNEVGLTVAQGETGEGCIDDGDYIWTTGRVQELAEDEFTCILSLFKRVCSTGLGSDDEEAMLKSKGYRSIYDALGAYGFITEEEREEYKEEERISYMREYGMQRGAAL